MEHPIKAAINSPHTEQWALSIGKLVLNFAAIELHTYWWLGKLSGDKQLAVRALSCPFKKRVDHVIELLKASSLDNESKATCSALWSEALELAKIRNAIVHNPLVFGWPSGNESGPPEVIGIPDLAHLGPKPRISQALASQADLNIRIDQAASIARQLFGQLDSVASKFVAEGPRSPA